MTKDADARGRYQKHCIHTLKKAVQALGVRALPTSRPPSGGRSTSGGTPRSGGLVTEGRQGDRT